MKAFLMFPERDFDPEQRLITVIEPSYRRRDRQPFNPWKILPWNAPALAKDLELETLFQAMAGDDPLLLAVARHTILSAVEQERTTILYRQDILRDCLANPDIVRALYTLSIEAVEEARKKGGWISGSYPSGILGQSIEIMRVFVVMLKRLRGIAETHAGKFASAGFLRLLTMLQDELSDAYFAEIEAHLKRLRFQNGVLVSAELGPGNKGQNYVLRKPAENDGSWLGRLFAPRPKAYTLTIAPRDMAGARALSELRDRGISPAANALAGATRHIESFLRMLRTELAFYVGCLNLHDRLTRIGEPCCLPEPDVPGRRVFVCTGLYDIALALHMDRKVVGNDIDAGASNLIVVTGANRGGKSTFLRSFGQARLMMQAGMFTPAVSLRAGIARGIFTHFKREEDAGMVSGKLDEELARMSRIVDHLRPDALVLFNESFASTNEREGAEIARQITTALAARRVEMVHVTHLYAFAHGLYGTPKNCLFLRAERAEGGRPSFRLTPGAPRSTSFGGDLYRNIFQPIGTAEP